MVYVLECIMYLFKHNINLPVIVLLLSIIVLSTLSTSRAIAVSEEHIVTSNLVTIVIMPWINYLINLGVA